MNNTIPGTSIPLTTFQDFLDSYRSVRNASDSSLFPNVFMEQFTCMRDEYVDIKTRFVKRQLSEAPQYNIFHILGVTRDEVRTHSAFLCHLLSPTASHGQGLLFLRTFLEHCTKHNTERFPKLPPFDDPGKWLVFSESHTNYGRIDILIQNPQEGFMCVIENKIDALEGTAQLERYGNWLKAHQKKYPYLILCYLTIHGSWSLTAGNTTYVRLSYDQDIADWLEDVMPQIQAPEVKAVVHQYQAIAANL